MMQFDEYGIPIIPMYIEYKEDKEPRKYWSIPPLTDSTIEVLNRIKSDFPVFFHKFNIDNINRISYQDGISSLGYNLFFYSKRFTQFDIINERRLLPWFRIDLYHDTKEEIYYFYHNSIKKNSFLVEILEKFNKYDIQFLMIEFDSNQDPYDINEFNLWFKISDDNVKCLVEDYNIKYRFDNVDQEEFNNISYTIKINRHENTVSDFTRHNIFHCCCLRDYYRYELCDRDELNWKPSPSTYTSVNGASDSINSVLKELPFYDSNVEEKRKIYKKISSRLLDLGF